ncbi:DUF6443 domain-containing protein [Chryseobacterium sp. MEBOG06]|uniref:DUF6443 domain-containing protein n=1 Tax=Chryseobacterium sp. MEBOG06 TaxID=2879938 RepID=UPI001F25097A|nr:DUF6443 domain-containing protein [Chryseobacterium sp. MEBOG06]UKB82746.1 DUF6443 domain-containing protein [Chryseobacterium sp. MEBOG06]
MKKILNILGVFLLAGSLSAQLMSNENYVSTKTYLDYPSAAPAKAAQKVEYYDGLGRTKQVIDIKASPLGKDVVNHFEYDVFGRESKTYLPVPQQGSQLGGIYSAPLANAPSVYGQEKIYGEKVIENSPLNRVQEQVQEGLNWSSRPVYYEEGANAAGEVIRPVLATTILNGATSTNIARGTAYYSAGQLHKKTVIDEDGNKTMEFTNGKGQMILSRKTTGSSDDADTYYLYNEYGQLACIIPPLLSVMNSWKAKDLDLLAYQYRYDGRGRMVEKKLPGKGWEYRVYDKQDRLILSQDPMLKQKGEWLFTKYDRFNRVAYTGKIADKKTRADLQLQADNDTGITYENRGYSFTMPNITVLYSNKAFPTGIKEVFTIKYYDTFPQTNDFPGFQTSIFGQEVILRNYQDKAKGFLAASFVKNIEDDHWTRTFFAYDSRGREISSYSINYLEGYTRKETQLNFAGLPKKSVTYHRRTKSDTEKLITETFEYDHQNRLLKHWHQAGTEPVELLAENTYNELSQLASKKVGNNMETVDYAYNIRGWRTGINDPENLGGKLFGYKMRYENPVTSPYLAKYNGNISEVDWKTADDGTLRRYSYEYDRLERLTKASYTQPGSTAPVNNAYNEALFYDLNGNIHYLKRNTWVQNLGVQPMDDLAYKYTGNILMSVTDNSGVYDGYPEVSGNTMTYDLNRNMTSHKDKGILDIAYNYLNQPTKIIFDKYYLDHDLGSSYKNYTNYLYSADGIKLRKEYTFGSGASNLETHKVTDYLDGFQYTDNVLNFVPTSEGYYDFVQKKYIYHYTDQVGNIRLSFYKGSGGAAVIDRVTNYYPFGLEFNENIVPANSISQNYRYSTQGQEKQEDTKWSSFKWRNYDPTIGRFFNIDPLSEKYAYQSHYNFSENRVVDGRELEGLEWFGVVTRVMPLVENSSVKPTILETVTKVGEAGTKQSETVTKAQQEHFNFGRYVEEKQLAEIGKEKNTQTFEFTDPKTGKTGRTIPDAMTDEGGTIEIKHVVKQSFTKQLRGQLEVSKSNGQKAVLRLNKSAEVTKPLKNSGIDIQRYTPPAKPKIDNIKVTPAPAPKLLPSPKSKDPCEGIQGCV